MALFDRFGSIFASKSPSERTPLRPLPRTIEEMRAAASEVDIPADVIERIEASAQRSATLVPDPNGDTSACGTSRLGGEPDLPVDVAWPTGPHGPLTFVAQVVLSELPSDLLEEHGMPIDGMLSLFIDNEELDWDWGGSSDDGQYWRLLWTDPQVDLERRPRPARSGSAPVELLEFPAVALTVRMDMTFPAYGSAEFERLDVGDADDAYYDLIEVEDADSSRVLGHAQSVQGDPENQAEQATGRGDGDESAWRLLLQIASHDEADMMWGDCGFLYVMITEDDLRAHNWDNAWLVMECA